MSDFPFPKDYASQVKLQNAVDAAMKRLGLVIMSGDRATILREWERMDPLAKAYLLMQGHKELHDVLDGAKRVLSLFDSPRALELEQWSHSLCEEFSRLLETLKPVLRARVDSGYAPWDPDTQPASSAAPVMERTNEPLSEQEERDVLRLLKSVGRSMNL